LFSNLFKNCVGTAEISKTIPFISGYADKTPQSTILVRISTGFIIIV